MPAATACAESAVSCPTAPPPTITTQSPGAVCAFSLVDTIVGLSLLALNAGAHPLLKRFHKPFNEVGLPNEKRTIVLLRESDYDAWLGTSPAEAPRFFGTFEAQELVAGPA